MHSLLLLIHIIGGGTALAAGAGALALPKGGRPHQRSGLLFFAAMAVMTSTGSLLAILKPERITAAIGLLSLYLVVTSWRAARRRDGIAGGFDLAALAFAAALAASLLAMGFAAAASPNGRLDSLPAAVGYGFGSLAALAAGLDLNFLLRRRLSQAQRIARHLWRMSVAMLIATTSFFLGQQDEFPEAMQGSPVFFLPSLATLAVMLFWILRVRLSKRYRRSVPPGPAAGAPAEDVLLMPRAAA